MVLIYLHDKPKPPNLSTPPTLTNQVPMWVPLFDSNKFKIYENQLPNPPYHSSFICDLDSMDEILKCLMKPIVKTNSSIPQDDLIVHNSGLNSYYPLSSTWIMIRLSIPIHWLAFHTLLIFVLLVKIAIRYKVVTLHS